ncbi:MAG: lysophospholipid acyltransferase family protein [Pseudomonadota bacterium]
MKRLAYGAYALVVFVTVALSTTAVIAIIPGLERRRRLARGAARLIFRLVGMRLHVHGLKHLGSEPVVVVANHASYLDGILLTAVLPPRFSFVIKREVTQVPAVHLLLRKLGSHFVERDAGQKTAVDARRILRHAHSGDSMAVFPEGTFRTEPGLRRFRTGAFAAAIRAGLPVVPVIISGSRALLPSGSLLPRRGPLYVQVCEPITPAGRDKEALNALCNQSREVILAGLDEPDLTALTDDDPPAALAS